MTENLKCDALIVGGGITGSLVANLVIACDMRDKDSLYLAAGPTSKELIEEHALRQRANLPGAFLDHAMLLEHFEIARAGAIVSPGAADADPMQLAHGLLQVAVSRGARLFEAEATEFDAASHSVGVQLQDGHLIEARHVVLATGYVMPKIIHSSIQTVSSSWAIATAPQPQNIWNGGALIWENRKDYLYARTTVSGRIVIGGEDSDEIVEPEARDALIPEKSRILAKLGALWPHANRDIACRWAGTFDTTRDGLPLIGPVPGRKAIYTAYGYGGNGITFSYLAAQLIGGLIAGETSPLIDDFALERDGNI
jgi:glycine/D-amino acid oxidase-like deaminating enzyme